MCIKLSWNLHWEWPKHIMLSSSGFSTRIEERQAKKLQPVCLYKSCGSSRGEQLKKPSLGHDYVLPIKGEGPKGPWVKSNFSLADHFFLDEQNKHRLLNYYQISTITRVEYISRVVTVTYSSRREKCFTQEKYSRRRKIMCGCNIMSLCVGMKVGIERYLTGSTPHKLIEFHIHGKSLKKSIGTWIVFLTKYSKCRPEV